MKGRRALAVSIGLLALCVAAMLLLGRSIDAEGSALSRGSSGWLAARRYLETRGCRVWLLDVPVRGARPAGVLVVSFPWQRLDPSESLDPSRVRADLARHTQGGGTLLLAYSRQPGTMERGVFEDMGFPWREVRGKPPLGPLKWWAYAKEEWPLAPVAGADAGSQGLRMRAPRSVPRMPAEAEELFRGPGEVPMAFVAPFHGSRIIIMPTEVLSNARLGQEGSADLLEALRFNLGDDWTFDEYHHGLQAPASPGAGGSQRVLDLWLAHLALMYVLAVLSLSRRFGLAWREPPLLTGSTGTFLLGLGALHHRLGHHREAARALVARAEELSPWLSVPIPARRRAEEAGAEGFQGLARELSLAQARGRRQA